MLHSIVCKDDQLQIKELESKNADEYYAAINIFFKKVEIAEQQQEQKVKS